MTDAPRPPKAPTVLLVDDDASIRFTSRRALTNAGYTVMDAVDGATALALVKSWQGPLDILVTDWLMPGMNGDALAREVRLIRPNLPVLFISGHIDVQPVQEGVLEEVFKKDAGFLQKPYTPEMLARRVRAILGGR
jgi:CheY-like chemotaxis protein